MIIGDKEAQFGLGLEVTTFGYIKHFGMVKYCLGGFLGAILTTSSEFLLQELPF